MGGSNDDGALSIQQTPDGGYITSGFTRSNDVDVTGNHGANDSWIVKLGNNGTIQWQKSMGGSNDESAWSVVETSDNGYIIAGAAYSNDGDVTGFHGGFGDFWIVKLSPDALLPVTLTDFSGEVNGKQNLLHWTTATEQNNTGFEVQRSNDGYNFSKIGFVNTKAMNGNSTGKQHYDFADGSYAASTNYYRLKQIDKDGKFTYSNIVVLKDDNGIAAGAAIIYPNPVREILNVKIASSNNNKITLLLTDLSGRLLRNKVTWVGAGESIMQIDVARLPASTYFLKIVCGDGCANAVQKFIKE